MIGSILLILGGIPWAGSVMSIVGAILLLIAIKGFSTYYQDPTMYDNALRGFIYYAIAAIAFGISFGLLVVGFVSLFFIVFGIISFIGGLVVAFLFYVMAAKRLRETMNSLAQKTGEKSFETAGMLIWYGALLTIIFIGGLLIFIAWIFVAIGFFSMRSPDQHYSPQQSYGNAPPSTSEPSKSRFCPNCGVPTQPGTLFCPNCGKQLS
jgi:uncharacterized membrane protein